MASSHKKINKRILQNAGYNIKHPLLLMPENQELTDDLYFHLGDELISFSQEYHSHSIEQFCIRWMISPERLKSLAQSHPYSSECYKIMLANLLLKRIDYVQKSKISSNIFLATLNDYSPSYARWITEIKKAGSNSQKDSIIQVMMQEMPNSPLVPKMNDSKKRVDDEHRNKDIP